jgi:hypothetical protein
VAHTCFCQCHEKGGVPLPEHLQLLTGSQLLQRVLTEIGARFGRDQD